MRNFACMCMFVSLIKNIAPIFQEFGSECLEEFPLGPYEFASLDSKNFDGGPNGPCFVACVFRRLNIIDEDGDWIDAEKLKYVDFFTSKEDYYRYQEYVNFCVPPDNVIPNETTTLPIPINRTDTSTEIPARVNSSVINNVTEVPKT